MPEPASSRSLEDILASIRRSLSEESVDGLVELSAAAVDAARAEQTRPAAVAQEAAPDTDAAAPRSAADALADELLREKLAGALVLDPDAGESDFSEADAAADDDPGEANVANVSSQDVEPDGGALAKLWVLRPGIEQAKPSSASAGQGLTLDPFAGVSEAGARESQPAPEFNLSPLELLGGAKPLDKPLASMPPLPSAQEAASPAEPARADASAPPRLDPASVALLRKLRASNAAAIDNIAKSNAESAEQAEPVNDVTEPPVEPPVDAVLELVTASPQADPQEPDTPAAAHEDVPPFVAPEPEVRPVLSMPERSTPLFGGHEDARPPLTSGLDHLLPEGGAVALKVEDLVAEVSVPEVATEVTEARQPAEPLEPVPDPEIQVSEPVVEAVLDPAPVQPVAEAAADAPQMVAPGGNKALEDMIAAVLEPVLQRLIETSIGPALEALVRREVERVLKEQRPPE